MQHTKFAQSGNETLSRPVPKLLVGDHHTRLSALHRITFIGPLVLWEDFHDEVVNEIKNLRPKLEGIINHENLSKVPPYYMNQEHVQVGDEHGVQGHLINLNITKSIIENVLQSLQSHIEKQPANVDQFTITHRHLQAQLTHIMSIGGAYTPASVRSARSTIEAILWNIKQI